MADCDAHLEIVAVITSAGMVGAAADLVALRRASNRLLLADEVDAWSTGAERDPLTLLRSRVEDCACTPGHVCRRNSACPRVVRAEVAR